MLRLTKIQTMVQRIKESGEPYVNSVAKVGLVEMPEMSMEQFFDFNVARAKVQAKYQRMWLENDLDALILPPAPFTAPKIDMWEGNISYTALWNLLDYPAAIVPVGRVNKDDVRDNAAQFGPSDEKTYSMYTGPEDYADAPVTVQVVGMHQEDERLTLVVEAIDQIVHRLR